MAGATLLLKSRNEKACQNPRVTAWGTPATININARRPFSVHRGIDLIKNRPGG
jgi:hypothetical protein